MPLASSLSSGIIKIALAILIGKNPELLSKKTKKNKKREKILIQKVSIRYSIICNFLYETLGGNET